ncbi:hypothetical protein SAMN05421766_103712 [Zobellia uliginosa]|uniref:Uncharacterized protein n=1 Tax=Zobellia uliginosa TaxID=143224 RepID=A0ABY1KX11_9FLAO|nr:hypothetical protein [Zobellia uliginosa]SIS73663.1 hypothetical protein SAMN05421766_103712 [Zobellia uliginosa]
MKAIRYIIFIPIIYLIIFLVYSLIPISLFGLMSLSKFWIIILLIFFGGMTVGLFQLLPGGITWLSAKISPSRNFAFYSILTISVLLGISKILYYWTLTDAYEDNFGVLFAILLTCLTIGFAASLSVGAGIEMFEEKEENLSLLMTIGSIVFYLGIFLTFCLLATKICNIDPEKTYSWYSGIWHGIFVIPNWVVSWFADDVYCKAPNSTTAYSIWWWISFIFIGFGILGGGNSRR